MRIILPLLALALSASPAFAKKDGEKAPSDPAQKKMCRTAASTGTILPSRTCKTRAEWDAIDKANALDAERALDYRRNLPQ